MVGVKEIQGLQTLIQNKKHEGKINHQKKRQFTIYKKDEMQDEKNVSVTVLTWD